MKISSDTIKILKNFSSINEGMKFNPGKTLSTVSGAGNIFALSEIEEEIPQEFALYDLPTFLSMLTVMDNVDVDIGENSLRINSESGSFEQFYCNSTLVKSPPSSNVQVKSIYEFEMSADELQLLLKAASVTSSSHISIKSNGKKVTLKCNKKANDTSSSYKKVVGETDKMFDVNVSVLNLKMINDSYKINISTSMSGKTVLLHFTSLTKKLQYWIACELDSKV